MRKQLLTMGCAALAALLALPMTNAQQSDGPIRRGVRGAAQGTADVVRRTGEATRNVIGGVAEGTANAVRRTGEAARNLGENSRDRLRGDSRENERFSNENQNLNNQIDGQSQGEYQSGYRGVDGSNGQEVQNNMQHQQPGQGYQNSGRTYQLQHDASGREFICMNGQRVYFDNQNSSSNEMDRSPSTPQPAMDGSENSRNLNDQNQSSSNYGSVPAKPEPATANSQQPSGSSDKNLQNSQQNNSRSEVERSSDSLDKADSAELKDNKADNPSDSDK